MDLSLSLVDLAGSVALLLWGVHMVQTGVQRAFGAKLRGFLGSALRNRFSAFLAGLGVTALLQSSTATGLMTAGFAANGLLDLAPALAVMLGANVGTTLIVQLLSFDVAEVAPALILIGVLMFRRASAGPRDFGRVLIGLGLLLMALHQFVALLTPYEDVPSLRMFSGRRVDATPARRHSRRRPDLGRTFERRDRSRRHVLCRPRHRAASSGLRFSAGRQSRQRHQSCCRGSVGQ
jgi:phosphate:Na+ symporter